VQPIFSARKLSAGPLATSFKQVQQVAIHILSTSLDRPDAGITLALLEKKRKEREDYVNKVTPVCVN